MGLQAPRISCEPKAQLSAHQTPLLKFFLCVLENGRRTPGPKPSWTPSRGPSAEFLQRVTGLGPRPPPAAWRAAIIALLPPGQHDGRVRGRRPENLQTTAEVMKTSHAGAVRARQRASGKREGKQQWCDHSSRGRLQPSKVEQDLAIEISSRHWTPGLDQLLPWVGEDRNAKSRLTKASGPCCLIWGPGKSRRRSWVRPGHSCPRLFQVYLRLLPESPR